MDTDELVIVFKPQEPGALVLMTDLIFIREHTRCGRWVFWAAIVDAKLKLVDVQTDIKPMEFLFSFLFQFGFQVRRLLKRFLQALSGSVFGAKQTEFASVDHHRVLVVVDPFQQFLAQFAVG